MTLSDAIVPVQFNISIHVIEYPASFVLYYSSKDLLVILDCLNDLQFFYSRDFIFPLEEKEDLKES